MFKRELNFQQKYIFGPNNLAIRRRVTKFLRKKSISNSKDCFYQKIKFFFFKNVSFSLRISFDSSNLTTSLRAIKLQTLKNIILKEIRKSLFFGYANQYFQFIFQNKKQLIFSIQPSIYLAFDSLITQLKLYFATTFG